MTSAHRRCSPEKGQNACPVLGSLSGVRVRWATAVAAVGLAVVAPATPASGASSASLPPQTLRGSEHRLLQYPAPSLATADQLAAAQRFRGELIAATRQWSSLKAAEAAGFEIRTAPRREGDTTVHYLHAEHRPWPDDPTHLDPRHPKALIYANIPPWPLILVGVMFGMPRGQHGLTPGGPITRWHTHKVCTFGDKRGLAPRHDGSCPSGATARQGSEMMHFWLTNDLRSAFAIHAPEPELGLAGLLPAAVCRALGLSWHRHA